MKIDIKINNDTLIAVNDILSVLTEKSSPNSRDDKAILSVAFELSDKFDSRAKKIIRNANLFDSKKTNKLTLKFHEAFTLLKCLMTSILLLNNEYKTALIRSLIAQLDKKLV